MAAEAVLQFLLLVDLDFLLVHGSLTAVLPLDVDALYANAIKKKPHTLLQSSRIPACVASGQAEARACAFRPYPYARFSMCGSIFSSSVSTLLSMSSLAHLLTLFAAVFCCLCVVAACTRFVICLQSCSLNQACFCAGSSKICVQPRTSKC